MPSNHLILYLTLLLLPSIFPSIRVFSDESTLRMRQSKYWNFTFSISPSNEYSGRISFRMDRLDLLAVQGTLKSLLQHHSSKASILRRSAQRPREEHKASIQGLLNKYRSEEADWMDRDRTIHSKSKVAGLETSSHLPPHASSTFQKPAGAINRTMLQSHKPTGNQASCPTHSYLLWKR